MLITEEYREEQRKLHENPNYGVASIKFAPIVAKIANQCQATEILDYGCGKGNLGKALAEQGILDHKVMIQHYEPSNPEWCESPDPMEMVCCIDVLEHIEPDCLDDVLDDLKRVTKGIGVFTIHTGPAAKTLSDGRNAHLIQEPAKWWLPKIMERFELVLFQSQPQGFYVVVQGSIIA